VSVPPRRNTKFAALKTPAQARDMVDDGKNCGVGDDDDDVGMTTTSASDAGHRE